MAGVRVCPACAVRSGDKSTCVVLNPGCVEVGSATLVFFALPNGFGVLVKVGVVDGVGWLVKVALGEAVRVGVEVGGEQICSKDRISCGGELIP